MMYEFQAQDGTVIEENHPMATAPETIERGGKRYVRIVSRSNKVFFNDAQVKVITQQYPRVDISVPRGTDFGAGTDAAGHPVVRSARHEREIMARHGFGRD